MSCEGATGETHSVVITIIGLISVVVKDIAVGVYSLGMDFGPFKSDTVPPTTYHRSLAARDHFKQVGSMTRLFEEKTSKICYEPIYGV